MTVQQLDFAEPFFQIDYVEDEASYDVAEKSPVFNLAERSQAIMYIKDIPIMPLKGTVAQGDGRWRHQAELLPGHRTDGAFGTAQGLRPRLRRGTCANPRVRLHAEILRERPRHVLPGIQPGTRRHSREVLQRAGRISLASVPEAVVFLAPALRFRAATCMFAYSIYLGTWQQLAPEAIGRCRLSDQAPLFFRNANHPPRSWTK